MKILLINNYYYRRGGSEAHFLALEKMLKARGHEVTIFSMQHNKNIKNENFWPKYNDKKLKNLIKYFYNFESKKYIKELLKNQTFDICHIHNINFHLTYSIISEIKKKKIPIVMTTHDYSIISPNFNLYKKWNLFNLKNIILIKEFILRKLFFSFKKNINAFICPSKFLKNKFEKCGFKNLNVIYNFCNINYDSYKNTNMENYFLYFGRLSKEKGLLEFINNLKNLKDFQFYIVGEGNQKQNIEKLIKKLKLGNNIKLMGFKSRKELKILINKAKFVVVPSLCEEVCNMAIIESICLKKTILAPNLGGNKELSVFNKNIIIYKYRNEKDAIDKINNLMYDNILTYDSNYNIFEEEDYYNNLINLYKQYKLKV
ncbi:MAG: glycosyltransferase family 4 protein [Patescibacteria group bacterium]|nr:glycosyltransferase family 4 protein [Patescibacteria group bacterium]